MKSAEQIYLEAFDNFVDAFYKLTNNKDPFNYNRAKELHLCVVLGLKWNPSNDGADAFDSEDRPVEIKTTIAKNINGTYNGLSAFETLSEFLNYLHLKFPDNTRHLFARYNGAELEDLYELPNSAIIDILSRKTRKYFDETGQLIKNSKSKDPRIGASVSMTEIKKLGEKHELHRQ